MTLNAQTGPPAWSQVSRATHDVIRDVQRTDTTDRAQRRREQLPAGADARSPSAAVFGRERAGAGQLRAGDLRQAANLTCGHHIPVYRATILLCQLAGITVSTGWMARRALSGRLGLGEHEPGTCGRKQCGAFPA